MDPKALEQDPDLRQEQALFEMRGSTAAYHCRAAAPADRNGNAAPKVSASVLVPRGGLRLHAQGYNRRVALTKTTTTTTNSYHYLSCIAFTRSKRYGKQDARAARARKGS